MVHEKAIAVFLIVGDIERNDSISGMLLRKGNDIYLWFTLMSNKGFVTLCGDQVWKLSLGALLLLINPYCRMEDFGLFHSWSKHHSVSCWLLTQRLTFHIYLFQSTLFLLKALAIFLHILRKKCRLHHSDRTYIHSKGMCMTLLSLVSPCRKDQQLQLDDPQHLMCFSFTLYSLKTGQFYTNDTRRCLHSCDLLSSRIFFRKS